MRGYDVQTMLTNRRVNKKIGRGGAPKMDVDNTLEENLNSLVIEAMGTEDRGKIGRLIERLHATDTATIREFLRLKSPGIDASIIINCAHCGQEMRMELPITESFFRPTETRSA